MDRPRDLAVTVHDLRGRRPIAPPYRTARWVARRVGDLGLGFCLDTCHVFAAGYPMDTEKNYRRTMRELDRTVGLKLIRVFHLNDSKREMGSRVDRHASIGEGYLGLDSFRRLMTDPRLDRLPMILETPDDARWAEEIQKLYQLSES